MKIIRTMASAALSASLVFLCSCGGEDCTITVRNITGSEISEVNIYPEDMYDESRNYLEENLPSDSEISVNLESYTKEETAKGYSLLVVIAEDNSEADFSMLKFSDGDKITFYLDDWGLAVGVNMTDEEIQEQKAKDHQDFLEYIEELEDETTEITE